MQQQGQPKGQRRRGLYKIINVSSGITVRNSIIDYVYHGTYISTEDEYCEKKGHDVHNQARDVFKILSKSIRRNRAQMVKHDTGICLTNKTWTDPFPATKC